MSKTTSCLGLLVVLGVAGCSGSPTAPGPVADQAASAPAGHDSGMSATQALSISALNTPPTLHVSWHVNLPTGGAPPIPGDPVEFRCNASDREGDALTVTLQLVNDTGSCATPAHCWSRTQSFPRQHPNATVTLGRTLDAPDPAMRGTLTCIAIDAQGGSTTSSICFNMAGFTCPV